MNLTQYFEKRARTYPQSIKGKFRNIKNISTIIFLAIYLLSPFLRYDRGPNMSNQAIMIDIPNSRAYFFFIELWPEEIYYLAGILIFAATALFFITSLFGRVWCGYSCPQTVWTDLFVKVEKFFQGDRNQRILLDRKKLSLEKFFKKFATHLIWILIGLITGFGFAAYFNDSFLLVKQLMSFDLSFNVIGWILGITAATYIMAGFAREQVCNYMCPYARFQSAMFDKDTLIISYDEKRGEPRSKYKQGESFENRGHCIDCQQCVVVCPQGIDIRNGLQMECIACGLCIDACNKVMARLGLPPGLIRYDTERNLANNDKSKNTAFKILRPRTFFYSAVLIAVGGIILFNLAYRSKLELNMIPDRNPLFVMLSDGKIRDGYTVKIFNKTHKDKNYQIKISGIENLSVKTEELDLNNLSVSSNEIADFRIYVSADEKNLKENGKSKIKFSVIDNETNEVVESEAAFISK